MSAARNPRGAILVALAFALLGAAPVQCGRTEPIHYAHRDDPAETVYQLGVRLRSRGHEEAAHETWQFLIERYPSSRWAERARDDLQREAPDAAPPESSSTRADR